MSRFSVLCFRKFPVAKKFMDKKEGGGGYRDFPSHIAEKFRRGILLCCASEISGSEKVYGKGGGVSRFSVEIFLSNSAEKFRS